MTKSSKKKQQPSKAKSMYSNNDRLSNQVKKEALETYVQSLVDMKLKSPNKQNRLDNKHYEEVHSKIQSIGMHWLTTSALKSRVIRAFKVAKFDTPSATSNNDPIDTKKTGRPMNSSEKDVRKKHEKEQLAKQEITMTYYDAIKESKSNHNKKMKHGTYKKIVSKTIVKYELDELFSFDYHACMARIYRGKEGSLCSNTQSPLKDVEDKFVAIILALSDIGSPLTVGETMALIQSLIKGTPAQQRLIEFQKRLKKDDTSSEFSSNCLGKISTKYYYSFMNRHKSVLESNKGRRFEAMRTKWLLFRNFLNMYLDIERVMIDARVAHKLDTPVWVDKKGEVVENVEDSFGCQVHTTLTLPQCCIVMDEVGGDLNMLNDGHEGGTKYVTRCGESAKVNSTKKSKKFTLLGLTTLRGDPLMCVVIIEGKERNPFIESGVDPFHPMYSSYDADHTSSNFKFFEDNYGPEKLFPGGPTCNFEGKNVPCMVRYSDKGSITDTILTDILRTIDELKLFQTYRENGAIPFLLVDGHQSRFSTQFLSYITDTNHQWKVTIGVPYGTSLWQVGDTYHQNGRFKIALVQMKKKIMDLRLRTFCSELESVPTDIMPMINAAWKLSFGDMVGNQEAIAVTGWNPLTKCLLLHPSLRRTMSEYDREQELQLGLVTEKKLELLLDQMEDLNDAINENSLNFNDGFAGVMIDKIVGYSDIEKARARNNEKAVFGTNTKTLLKQVKKLTSAGELVKVANTHELGIDLLTEIRNRKNDLEAAANEKMMKKKQKRLDVINEYIKLSNDKPDLKSWNISDYKTALKALKTDVDGPIPAKKENLVAMYDVVKHRNDLVTMEYHNLNAVFNG